MEKSFLIGIAGPSGAGKSTFCRRLEATYANVGRLKLDDFFRDLKDIEIVDGYQNWDDPSTIKWNLLTQAARTLKTGTGATVPNYNRTIDRQDGEKCILPQQVIIVDGFLTLHHPELRELLDMSIFFHLDEEEQVKRRKERQPWVKDGYLYEIMLPAARKNVFPTARHADRIINASKTPEAIFSELLFNIHQLCELKPKTK